MGGNHKTKPARPAGKYRFYMVPIRFFEMDRYVSIMTF
jgi:hypothetical protein